MNRVSVKALPYLSPERLFPFFFRNRRLCWLDTVAPRRRGSFSVMAVEPSLVVTAAGRSVVVAGDDDRIERVSDPFDAVQDLLDRYRLPSSSFYGPGFFGYLGYDLGRHVERIPSIAKDDSLIPDLWLGLYDHIIVFDHGGRTASLLSAEFGNAGRSRDRKAELLRTYRQALGNTTGFPEPAGETAPPARVSANMNHASYVAAIRRIREYIAAGDVYQINFARRLAAEGVFDPAVLYRTLRRVNPTAYSAFLDTGDFHLLSNSPELFLRREGRRIMTRPMKGTRPRGKTPEEDARHARELMASAKDKAELVMIVDLERNDFGRVCEKGSVRVSRSRILERYRTVYQTTAVVEGLLRPEVTTAGFLKAVFPGGSITGAPKVRAMEIIEELEPHRRSFYTGALGYLGCNGNAAFNLMIRTILQKGNKLFYPVGGGIVWDSTPEKEYEETITKAKAFFLALGCDDAKKHAPVLV